MKIRLDWSDHVKHIITPISRNIGILYKVRYFVLDKILVMLYNTLIFTLKLYLILYPTFHTVIFCGQHARHSSSAKEGHSCMYSIWLPRPHKPIIVKLKCLKVDDINFLQTAIFMFRFKYYKPLPDSFSSMFQSNNAVHSYSTIGRLQIYI